MSRVSLPASNSLQEELEVRTSDAIFPPHTKLDEQRRHEKTRNCCAFSQRIEKNWYEFCPQIFLDIEERFRFQRNTSTEKRSICKCSNTLEARNFTSKDQAHVHFPCDKCEDRAVYPMVAWRRTRKRVRYSDAIVDDPDGVELDIAVTSIQPSSNEEITSSSKTSVSND